MNDLSGIASGIRTRKWWKREVAIYRQLAKELDLKLRLQARIQSIAQVLDPWAPVPVLL